jgi:YggT family protein
MFIIGNLFIAIAWVINAILTLLWILIFVRALISWVNPDPYNPIVQFLYRSTEPLLLPLRRVLPPMGLDLSPILAFFIIIFLQKFLVPTLYGIGFELGATLIN